jgi:hypothetical protein
MQFKVPQFIDIEDKILGPLTWRQFAYCLGAAGITYISLRFVPGGRIVGLIVVAPFAGLFLALAFVKVNNRPFIDVLENGFKYITNTNIYTWQKDATRNSEQVSQTQKNTEQNTQSKNANLGGVLPQYERKNLRDLATNLDMKTTSSENI